MTAYRNLILLEKKRKAHENAADDLRSGQLSGCGSIHAPVS